MTVWVFTKTCEGNLSELKVFESEETAKKFFEEAINKAKRSQQVGKISNDKYFYIGYERRITWEMQEVDVL